VKAKYLHALLILSLFLVVIVSAASAAPGNQGDIPDGLPSEGANTDNPSHPLGDAQNALRLQGFEARMNGKTNGPVAEVAKGQFVELEREGEDSIWTVIAEFGPLDHPEPILYSGVPGPLHNEIPEPDRSVDNTTIWSPDFTRSYYEDLLFSEAPGAVSMRNFYIEQSSNRYTVNGDVTDWVQVPFNAAAYGRNYCGGIVCAQTWVFVNHSIDAWYDAQIAAGQTPAQIDDYLSQFDVWDRYDMDGDGNFNEPDGYIDHFQSVHAGEGEETGGGAQGQDAIWSHRWYAYYGANGPDGPGPNSFGGVEIGNTGYWIGDYTIEPENGGVGVFAHEFAHDSGLPDQYNTAGGGDNGTGFWTIMSSGSYLNDGTTDLGSKPGDFNAWEKFYLGWLNYEVAFAGAKSEHKLGPAEANTKQAQALFVVLPDKEVTEVIAAPYGGSYFYYSGSGNDLDNSMSRSVTLPAGNPSLTAMVNYEIETDWDYAYVTVNGVEVATSLSTNTNPNGQNFGLVGITDFSGGWVPLTVDLTAFAGQTVDIGFRYWTDGAAVEAGFMVDDVQISGQPLDDAESDFGWTFDGFNTTTGTETGYYFNAYVAEFRQYRDYDEGLATGPYNFGFLDVLGNWVEHFPYQDGLLISYWDESYSDNNTVNHPGGGMLLPIDAHPTALMQPDGVTPWRARVQVYDATFTKKDATDALTLHINSVPSYIPSLPAVSVFNDSNSYWDPAAPLSSVIVPNTGTTIRIKSVSAQGSFMQVAVNK